MRPRRFTVITGAFAGLAVILLALFLGNSIADLQRNAAASPSPSIAPPPSPSASATATPSPTPLPSGRPSGGIEAYPIGALRGEYAFVLNGGATTTPGAVAEVWAIPLAAAEPRLAARYVNAKTPSTGTGANVLARQFSPDGLRDWRARSSRTVPAVRSVGESHGNSVSTCVTRESRHSTPVARTPASSSHAESAGVLRFLSRAST